MRRKIASLFLVCSLLLCTGIPGLGQSCDPAIKLFNGQNLDGWYTFLQDRGRDSDPRGVFTVADGMIRISGEEWGCITTEKEYENYRIVVEFKWGDETFERPAGEWNIMLVEALETRSPYISTEWL